MNKYTLSIKDLSSKEMQYNTQQKRMPLPEYGRSIQNMVDYALTIQDRAERQRCANTIINIMGNMFPHLRDVPDFKHKLWDHLAIMSGFELDIDYPYEIIRKDNLVTRPDHIPIRLCTERQRHRAKNDGFSGARLARQNVQPRLKEHFRLFNQRQVPDMQTH